MKNLALFIMILFYSATPANINAVAMQDHPAFSFCVGTLFGTLPILGHTCFGLELRNFQKSSQPNVQGRVKPAIYGLVAGTALWIAATEFLKDRYPESWWKPYAYPSLPAPIIMANLDAFLHLIVYHRSLLV